MATVFEVCAELNNGTVCRIQIDPDRRRAKSVVSSYGVIIFVNDRIGVKKPSVWHDVAVWHRHAHKLAVAFSQNRKDRP